MIVTVTPNPVLDRTLTVPEIAFDAMVRATAVRLDWGGKGFNVSRALLALGVESVAMGYVGGATGRRIQAGLRDRGLATDLVTIAGETRTNVVVTDGERYVKVNEAGPTVRAEEVAHLLARVRARAAPGDLWALCGSLPPGVPVNVYATLTRLLRGRGARVILDTSGEALRLGCAAGPDLIKPNAAEAEALTGVAVQGRRDALRAARALLKMGPGAVALSLGAEGVLLARGGAAVWASPPPISVRNVVGAGDALLAGVIKALAEDLPLAEQARWGVAVGTASALHPGVSVVDPADVARIHAGVTVSRDID
jgi:1-phosphofructokinase family hexose kinase